MDSPRVRLGTLCELNKHTLSRQDKWDFVNYLDTGNLTQNIISTVLRLQVGLDKIPSRAQRKAAPGDILYSMVRPNQRHYGLLHEVPENFVVSTGFCVITPKKNEADPEYLYYFLSQDWVVERLHRIGEGAVSSYPAITEDDLAALELPKPRLEIQKSIVAVPSCIDAKIDINRQMNAELETFSKLLYDYWFVQFDFPDKRGRPYKSSGGKMVYSEKLKREIPEGWSVLPLNKVTSRIQAGGTPTSTVKEYYDGDVNWFTTQELQDQFLTTSDQSITDNAVKCSSAKIFPPGTILIAIYAAPTVGRLGILSKESTFNQACCGIVPNESELPGEYIFMALKAARPLLNVIASGTAQKNLSAEMIRDLDILVPDPELIKKYVEIVRPLFQQRLTLLCENECLISHRDWLLPMLMNGQLKVGT